MNVLRFCAPALSALFGIYCVTSGIVDSSMPTVERFGGAFLGVLLLLLAFAYVGIFLREQQESAPSNRSV